MQYFVSMTHTLEGETVKMMGHLTGIAGEEIWRGDMLRIAQGTGLLFRHQGAEVDQLVGHESEQYVHLRLNRHVGM